jgi:hypothetical protein
MKQSRSVNTSDACVLGKLSSKRHQLLPEHVVVFRYFITKDRTNATVSDANILIRISFFFSKITISPIRSTNKTKGFAIRLPREVR